MLLASLCMLTAIVIFENALHRKDGKQLAAITLYRLGLILLTACLMCSYFVIPFLSNRSFVCDVEHRKWKFDSVGITWLISAFKNGDLLDFGFRYKTIPILSSLGWCVGAFHVMLHVVSCRSRSKRVSENDASRRRTTILYAWVVVSYGFWIIMFAGPRFFGENLPIPFSKSLHFHRFIGGVQVFAIWKLWDFD